ncbi:MAG TPA: OmpH family outer membrane protein [Pyrinomonadaceae bacterium]|nr:OmpH family outer membrane protein [Pyrinomonadaceae bacterium]
MKIASFFAAVGLLTTVAVSTSAQTQQRPPAGGAPQAAPQAPANVAVPDSKMAVIYSEAFLDAKTGIAKFTSLMNTLNREFQPRQTEITNLQTRINTLTKEINDTQAVADPNTVRQKREQLDQVNLELKRKGEDAQAAYEKRRQEIFMPLQRDIGTALEAFAKARGITVIVDGSNVPFAYTAENIDITRAFINDFNSKNPATAAVTAPAATPTQP